MAQTKRKRQTKHRGNAAGVVEVRGRTSRPPSKEERKQADRAKARERRLTTPPTWKGSFMRAALVAGFMFLALLFVAKPKHGSPIIPALVFAVLALLIYTPGSYYLELFLFRRRAAQRAAGKR